MRSSDSTSPRKRLLIDLAGAGVLLLLVLEVAFLFCVITPTVEERRSTYLYQLYGGSTK